MVISFSGRSERESQTGIAAPPDLQTHSYNYIMLCLYRDCTTNSLINLTRGALSASLLPP